jgi:hypothetical protein
MIVISVSEYCHVSDFYAQISELHLASFGHNLYVHDLTGVDALTDYEKCQYFI